MRRDVRQDVRGEGPLAVGCQPAKWSAVELPGRSRSTSRMGVSSWGSPGALVASTTKASKIGWAGVGRGGMSFY